MPSGIRVIDRIIDQSDVFISNYQNADILVYNILTQKWENKQISDVSHTHSWLDITSTPTTLSGYGITDAASSSHNHDGSYSPVVGSTSITTLGTIITGVWNASVIPVNKGGTGQTSATSAINALLPSQSGNVDRVLKTNGTNVFWGIDSASGGSEIDLSKTFTYDDDGRLSVVSDSSGTKTFYYNANGTLNQIVGTGPYVTKTFVYDEDGSLSGIVVS